MRRRPPRTGPKLDNLRHFPDQKIAGIPSRGEQARPNLNADPDALVKQPDRGFGQPGFLQQVAEQLLVLTEAEGAAIIGLDAQGLICRASAGIAPAPGSRPRSDSGLTRLCFESKRSVATNDAKTDYRINSSIARSLQLGSVAAAPIQFEGVTVGVVEVLSGRRSAFEHRQIELLEVIARALAPALTRPSSLGGEGPMLVLAPAKDPVGRGWIGTAVFMAIVAVALLLSVTLRDRIGTAGPAAVMPSANSRPVPHAPASVTPDAQVTSKGNETEVASPEPQTLRPASGSERTPKPEQVFSSDSLRILKPGTAPGIPEQTPPPSALRPPSALGLSRRTAPLDELLAVVPVIRPTDATSREFVLDRTLKAHSNWVTGVAFSPDGRLASASWDRTVRLWDTSTGMELNTIHAANGGIQALAFSPDGRWLAAETSSDSVTLWDASSGRQAHTFAGRKSFAPLAKGWVYSIAFSPDGRLVASAIDSKTVRLWDVQSGRVVRDLPAEHRPVIYIAFSRDGRYVASGSDDKIIEIWDAVTGTTRTSLLGHKDTVLAVAFSPNGRILASASVDRTVKLWDLATGREVTTLAGHNNRVTTLAFSPDGQRLASGSWDNTVRIWDVSSRRELQTLKNDDRVYSLAFGPHGRWLASGSERGKVRLWRLEQARSQESAQLQAGKHSVH